ncbi:MAG: hypothetical protein MSA82_12010, partial [Oscillospiraceae bacterium]|nr:hypothetical protein [Oscillospiraceae bacterium]
MSNKKKNKHSGAPKPQNAKKPDITPEEEKNIPVQSLSEMMAFSDEAEEEPETKDIIVPKPSADNAPKAEEKSAPKTEDKPAPKSEAKPAPKAEDKPVTKTEEKAASKAEDKPAPKSEEKPAPKTEEKPAPKADEDALSSGPMISAAEAQRRAVAEDALDRDLAAARKKKLQEEAYNKRQREIEMQKEAERLSRAEQAKQRQDNVQEMAKKRAELKAAQEAIAASEAKAAANTAAAAAQKNKSNKRFNRAILSMKAGKAVLVAVILIILAYT